ncbi:MAG: HlyD family efflux transporter periplasmic adaptor subunit [Clostridia bacterium]|nr:HlyD family efflux transporter periplasmic adaptor subunit [Clostridia bacterium]
MSLMKMMKRFFCLTLTLVLLLALPALAAEDLTNRPIADGQVTAVAFEDVTAPFSGTLTSFDLTVGDVVAAQDVLMGYVTTRLYAPESGTIKIAFASVGDDAAAVTARYGGIVGIEPTHAQTIEATTSGAYDEAPNKRIRLGEMLWFKSDTSSKEEGYGRVIAVTNASYRVEIQQGDFEADESLTLYRNENRDDKKCVGKGNVARCDDVLVRAEGRVIGMYAVAGDAVQSGQLLAEVVSADAEPSLAVSNVISPVGGVIASVAVQPGQQVWKGQTLCRIYLTDAIEVTADVDEMDLGGLRVGDAVPVTLDVNKNNILSGTVTEISALGITKQNAAYYTVHVSIPNSSGALGASASIYLPAKK